MTILVVDDHQIFREAFILLLRTSIDAVIQCDEAKNGEEAIAKIRNNLFDMIFLDVNMPKMDGFEACKKIRNDYPQLPIIMLTQFDNDELIFHFFKLGVSSFLPKEVSTSELSTTIKNIRKGKKYFSPHVTDIIKNRKANEAVRVDLTCQETRLIQLLKEGLTSKEIADEMGLSFNTINTYRERLLDKTKTNNVAQLITFGFRNGILK
jgi:DNA-binding NarL/FixJ family response regulator